MAAAGLCAAAMPARADDWLAVWPSCAIADNSRPEFALLYPSEDLPAVVHAGDTLVVRIRTPAALTPPPGVQQEDALRSFAADLYGAALRVGVPETERHRHRLPVVSIRPDGVDSLVYRMRVEIPAYLADGTYGLSLRTSFGVRRADRVVRVLSHGAQPRFARAAEGEALPPSAAIDVWLSDRTLPSSDSSLGEAAPLFHTAGSALALRVNDELWVRSGCSDARAFEREVAGVIASEGRRRVDLDTVLSRVPSTASAAVEPVHAVSSRSLWFDNRASAASAELSLLVPFAASASSDSGTLAFHPAREPSARVPAVKVARLRVPAGAATRVSIGESGAAPQALALQLNGAHSGQPARVRVIGAEANARVAFAWGFARTAYESPTAVTTLPGPLAQPIRAQVFRADGFGQVATGHVWVEPYRPPTCAIGRSGLRPAALSVFSVALWAGLVLVVAHRTRRRVPHRHAKNARGPSRPE